MIGSTVGLLLFCQHYYSTATDHDDINDDETDDFYDSHSASIGQSLRLVIRGDTELTVRNQAGAITNVAQLALNASGELFPR